MTTSPAQAAKSHSQMAEVFEGIVLAIGKLAEQRDPYTAGHAESVARLSLEIGKEMGMDPDPLEGLRIAALLHDIGKIAVPAEILTKPSKLTDLERAMVNLHASAGHDILRSIAFPWPVAEAVHQHHERLDGSGYPNGLQGNQIIAEARILAVADVVDAMTAHRPYRPGLGMGQALEEIQRGRGARYDPAVAEACLAVVTKMDKRILVVDDEVPILEIITEYMEMLGYEVQAFDRPTAALGFFAETPFPLVLSDLDMPEMHGLEFIRRVRELSPDVQVMVLTGRGGKEEAVEVLRLGVSDFVDKPVSLPLLKEIVDKAFRRIQSRKFDTA